MSNFGDSSQTIILPVDRPRAAMRGLWRLALLLIIAAPAFIMAMNLDWRLLRLSDPASFFGLGLLWLGLASVAMALLFSATRWLLLAVWRGPTQVRITPRQIVWSLGPFGKREIDWQTLDLRLYPEIEPELLDRVPSDALSITIRDRTSGADIARKLESFVRINPAQIVRLIQRQ